LRNKKDFVEQVIVQVLCYACGWNDRDLDLWRTFIDTTVPGELIRQFDLVKMTRQPRLELIDHCSHSHIVLRVDKRKRCFRIPFLISSSIQNHCVVFISSSSPSITSNCKPNCSALLECSAQTSRRFHTVLGQAKTDWPALVIDSTPKITVLSRSTRAGKQSVAKCLVPRNDQIAWNGHCQLTGRACCLQTIRSILPKRGQSDLYK
jgi:hypothetical protein